MADESLKDTLYFTGLCCACWYCKLL